MSDMTEKPEIMVDHIHRRVRIRFHANKAMADFDCSLNDFDEFISDCILKFYSLAHAIPNFDYIPPVEHHRVVETAFGRVRISCACGWRPNVSDPTVIEPQEEQLLEHLASQKQED